MRAKLPKLSPAATRELALALFLVLAAVFLTVGAAAIYPPAGWLVAGVCTAVLAVLFLFGDEESP